MSVDCVLSAWCRHEAELYRHLLRQVEQPTLADDLLQDVFVRALGAGSGFCDLDNVRAWLFKVAQNALKDYQKLRKVTVEVDGLPLAAPSVSEEPFTALQACIASQLPGLSYEDQMVLSACDLDGINQADFARQHDLSLPAVKARLRRARQRLRDLLISQCGVEFDSRGRLCCHQHHRC